MASTTHLLILCLDAGHPFLGDPKHTNNCSDFLHSDFLHSVDIGI